MTSPGDVLDRWSAQWGETAPDSSLAVSSSLRLSILTDLAHRLEDNYPFGHAVYAGQMLKPPHDLAAEAYSLAMRINPNNHALDGGPATAALERECVAALAAMVGYAGETSLGHLTSSGTIANLEALWIARELHPGKQIASSVRAHYTHARMCAVLGVEHVAVQAEQSGRMDLDDLERLLASKTIGTVVATLGTTSLGAVDDLPAILDLARMHGARVHVDAAYGGFFRLLAETDALDARVARSFRAMGDADSIVIDPHKHGLQPYGCGSVLFRDASIGRFYQHDSPYTYFTSDELHLGEISLECSRAGAAAAAFWATLRAFPLTVDGLGAVLTRTRLAAIRAVRAIGSSEFLGMLVDPDLDIVCFYPVLDAPLTMTAISEWTERIFRAGMRSDPDGFFLAKLTVGAAELPISVKSGLVADAPSMTVLRSVLMKPEHADFAMELIRRVDDAASRTAPISR